MNSSPRRLQCMSTIRKTKIHTTLAEHRHDYKILVPKKYSQLCTYTRTLSLLERVQEMQATYGKNRELAKMRGNLHWALSVSAL